MTLKGLVWWVTGPEAPINDFHQIWGILTHGKNPLGFCQILIHKVTGGPQVDQSLQGSSGVRAAMTVGEALREDLQLLPSQQMHGGRKSLEGEKDCSSLDPLTGAGSWHFSAPELV